MKINATIQVLSFAGVELGENGIMKKRFYISMTALVVAISGILMLNVLNGESQAALPRDCDNNAIIHCGAITSAELKQKYHANKTGDLKKVYDHYGISDRRINNGAPMGEVHKDGRVTLNGKTVATNANSIGRQNIFSGSSRLTIGGKTYFQTPPSRSFARESITAYVFLDEKGKFIGAILTSCGNPVSATPVPPPVTHPKPAYKCVSLTADKLNRDEYSFKATASATGGATIVNYTYDFGDGKSTTEAITTVKHTYDEPGEYTAKLTANIKVNGEIKPATAPSCEVKVVVKEKAAYSCDALTAKLIKKEDRTYAYDLKYTVTGDAKLNTVDFDFGNGQTLENVDPGQLNEVTHSYAKAGTYTTVATLHFTSGDSETVKDDECQVTITENPEVCPHNPELPKDSPDCVPPVAELPKTGPMSFIGGSLGLGSLVAAGYYWHTSRRNLLSAWLER